ncbi:hypothetical protein GYMLUDRAFT_234425 [Collybiopsis luxurians FD-317 M1]|uniref:EML-like second beta-propeller domain-containing protein n=1 Tax=Collybiopsis luxurians FD-317 M1 TaxID=944289 RepID=A0A0D0C7Y9_9AGAR|nr:hypothetical protein GYMLUDRAFT_234425 [Collybiopsis luxurians FD-317 M1]
MFIRERFDKFQDEISKSNINSLVSKADGLFIWAKTATEFILESGMDMAANIQVVLQPKGEDSDFEHPHAKLYELYREILKQYFTKKQSQQQCQLVLGLIISAYEPLTLETLARMLRHGSNMTYSVVKKVIDVLKAVLYLNDRKVYYHLSLAEFLSSEQCPSEFKIERTSQHQNLASICLKVLMTELKFNICNLQTSSIPNCKIQDLKHRIDQCISSPLQYSSQWWANHVENVEESNLIVQGVRDFTSNCQIIFWMECMSLMGKTNGIIPVARMIIKWAQKMKDMNVLTRMQELEKFTNAFSTALHESTPHLYISGCALLPSESLLRENMITHLNHTVKVTSSGHAVRWEKMLHVIQTKDQVNSVVYSPDGQYVAFGSNDMTVRIWNAQTGVQVGEPLKGHTDWVMSVAYSPDGQCVVSGSNDKTVRIWNVQTGVQVGEPLKGHTEWVMSVAYSPDGQYVVSSSDDMTPLKGHTDWVMSVAYSPDGQYVVSSSDDMTVRIWNAQTGVQVGEPLKGHTNPVWSVAYSPDGQYVVSGSTDKTVRIWNAQTGVQVGESMEDHTREVQSVVYSPDGQYVVSGSDDGTVRIWNAQTGVQVGEPLKGHTNPIWSVACSPDGQYVVSGSDDKTVRIWNAQTGVQVGEPLKGHTDWVMSVAYSPDGQCVVSSSDDMTVRIWNAQAGVQVGEPLKGHTNAVQSVAYSPDGQYVVSGSTDNTVRIWNAQTGVQVGEPLKGHTREVQSVAYSPDGQYVVSGSNDKTLRIWNAQTGVQVGEPLKGHTDIVLSVAYSPDGQYVVSGSDDKTVRIWNVQIGVQVGEPLKGHTDRVLSVAYSPDGQCVVSGSFDNSVRIWRIQSFLHNACNLQLPPGTSSGYIDDHGWLHSSNGLLILWLPPHLRGGFREKRQILTIPANTQNSAVFVNWSNFVHGTQWTHCWAST